MRNGDKLLQLLLLWACSGGIVLLALTGVLAIRVDAGWADVPLVLVFAHELGTLTLFVALGVWEMAQEILRGEA